MIRFFLLFICLTSAYGAIAMPGDSSAYQTQRLKINSLLAERSSKFGQYDLSLSARTGIFGLQTKQDLRNSNDILREIIMSDNNIFRELKILMNYKDLQVQEVQSNVSNTNKRIRGYMLSIKKLQDENDALRMEAAQIAQKSNTSTYIIIILCMMLIASGVFMYSMYSRLRKARR